MEKKKIVVLIGSLQATIARFISAFTVVVKLKEKLKYIHYLLFPSLTPNVFVSELDIVHVNVKRAQLDKTQIHCLTT